jgi:hypothetical protein
MELGVEPVDIAGHQLVHEALEGRLVTDPAVVAHAGRTRHEGAGAADRVPDPGELGSFGARAVASLRAAEG